MDDTQLASLPLQCNQRTLNHILKILEQLNYFHFLLFMMEFLLFNILSRYERFLMLGITAAAKTASAAADHQMSPSSSLLVDLFPHLLLHYTRSCPHLFGRPSCYATMPMTTGSCFTTSLLLFQVGHHMLPLKELR